MRDVCMSDPYGIMQFNLQVINCDRHEWNVRSNLRFLALQMGMKLGYRKYCCILCECVVYFMRLSISQIT
jgi:hypothetical protein